MIKMFLPKAYFNDLFDGFLNTEESTSMKCDIYEKDGNYHVEMDVPGFDKKDINVECDKGYLTITASKEQKEEEEDKEKKYLRRERDYGKYQRQFYLGNIDEESIKAEFKDGTLKITVPKKEETSKKVIEVK